MERPFSAQRGKLSSRRGARCAWQWDGPARFRRPRLHRAIRYLRAALLARRKSFRLHAELGQHVVQGNAFAAGKKGLALVKVAAVLIAESLTSSSSWSMTSRRERTALSFGGGDLPPFAAIEDGLPAAGFVLEDR